MTVADLVKDEEFEHLHPRGEHGRFSRIGAALKHLAHDFGEVIGHEEFGEADHPHSSHGVFTLHADGDTTLHAINEDGTVSHLASEISPSDIDELRDALDVALTTDLPEGSGYHSEDIGEVAGIAVSRGRMGDGTPFVSLDTEDEGVTLTDEHAEALLANLGDLVHRAEAYSTDDPYFTHQLAPGETLLRKPQKIAGELDNDAYLALVETPDGVHVRLGQGREYDAGLKGFTGGQGDLVADIDAAKAREVLAALDEIETQRDTYDENLGAFNDASYEFYDTPEGEELQQLSHIKQEANPALYGPNTPRGPVAPPGLSDEQEARRAVLHAQAPRQEDYGVVDEGEEVFSTEVTTSGSTLRLELRSGDENSYVVLSTRPATYDVDEYANVGEETPEVHMSDEGLAKLRKLLRGAFPSSGGEPITKSEGAGMTTVYAWAPITKVEDQDDGTVIVYGPASDASLDRDGQRMNQAWLDKAMPRWFNEGANIREQHDPKRAIGVGVGLTRADNGAWMLTSHIVDPVAVKKVKAKVLKGYSIGIKDPKLQMGKAEAPNGEVVDGYVCETSLADRPSNAGMLFCIAKADSAESGLVPVENPTIVESPPGGETEGQTDANVWDEPDEAKVDQPQVRKFVSAKRRKAYAASGVAMPNGDFPIPDAGHLESAIGHLGNYNGDRAAAKRHIISRARALGLTSKLPEDWGVTKAERLVADLGAFAPFLAKYDESADIAGAEAAMAAIARLIASEAAQLAEGREEEADDIRILLDAHKALCYFRCREENQNGTGDGTEPSTGDVLTKDSPAMGYKTDNPDLVKAVTEATAQKERAEGLQQQVAQLEAKLAAMPQPGGPALMKTATTAARTTDTAQLRHDAQVLLAKSDATQDPRLKTGYWQRAQELLAKANA